MLISESISHNSQLAYSTAVRNYEYFCSTILSSIIAWPPTQHILLLWISYLSDKHLSYNNKQSQPLKFKTIRLYLSAIGTASEQRGYSNPNHHTYQLNRAMKGIKRLESTPQKHERYPVTTQLIKQIYFSINTNSSYDIMLYAAFTMGTYALLRAGEFTISTPSSSILTWNDIAFKNEL